MLTCLILTILLCQYNFTSAHQEKNVVPKNGRRIFETSSTIIEQLLIKTYEDFGSFINLAQYPLKTFIRKMFPKEFFGRYFNTTSLETVNSLCIFCKFTAKYFFKYCRSGASISVLKRFNYFMCSLLIHLVDASVCRSLLDLNSDTLIYIARNNKQLTAEQACAILLQPYGCYRNERPKWSIYIPPGQSVKPRNPTQKIGPEPFNVLHITDPHMDSMYTPGATAKCGKPVCCEKDQGRNVNGAGYWADYRDCDMPWHTMESLLDNIAENIQNQSPGISYIYFTGDIISHRIWDTSIESNTREIKKMFRMINEKLGFIRVFPIIGNHESHPLNLFAPLSVPEKLSTKWLYNLVAEEWSIWLPESALATIRIGDYYTVVVKPGLRIIALNSNVCYSMNWWLLYQNEDLYDQLSWLVKQLEAAEMANEAVHILAHNPPGDAECITAWSHAFQKIVERFAYTITAQFNGHTHLDELRIFYNSSNISQPIGVAYNGGSFTTFSDVNPNYRIYSISPQNFRVINYREWIFQVPIANFAPTRHPKWYELYSFKHAYRLETLELDGLDSLVEMMGRNKSLLKEYYRFKVRDSENGMMEVCGTKCMRDNLCSIVTTVFDNNRKCDQLVEKYFK